MNFKKIISYLLILINIGCEEQNTNNSTSNDSIIITPNYEEKSFYLNLTTGLEDSTNWHISLQKIMVTSGAITASMPTIITNSSTLIGIENSYNNLISLPENIEWQADTTLLSYAGEFIVLDYQFTCENPNHNHPHENTLIHQIIVWDYVYLFKIIETGKIYKVQFEEYNSGVVLFKYSELK